MKKVFESDGDFGGLHCAQQFLKDNGFSYGALERGSPIGIMYGEEWVVAKWKNLTRDQRAACHGTMTTETGSFREAAVTVTIKDDVWRESQLHVGVRFGGEGNA